MQFKLKMPNKNKVFTHFSGSLVHRNVSTSYTPKWVWYVIP